MNIVLIGYRGSGKTTIGRALAARLGRPFIDTDLVIIEQAGGKTIKELFEQEGEPGFRDRESRAIRSVAGRPGQVIALGGGAVLRSENIEVLKREGRVVWLQAAPEILHARICADTATNAMRPNLTAAGGLEEVRHLLATRTPHYTQAADMVLDIGTLSVADAVEAVLARLPREL